MLDASAYDPMFLARAKRAEPRLWPNHQRLVRHAHAATTSMLAELDDELEVLTARRRQLLVQLDRYRERLWPRWEKRHVRRPPAVDEAAFPPAVVGARPVVGRELRQLGVAILRRYGSMSLRELHALIHRHGYVIDVDRPVQRLGDAMAYEVAHGRLVRVARGRYGPAAASSREPELVPALPWSAATEAVGSVDPDVRTDPEHWSGGAWPPERQLGGDLVDGEPDEQLAKTADDLAESIHRVRTRAAELVTERTRAEHRSRLRPEGVPTSQPIPTNHHPPSQPFEPLGDDSSTNRRQGTGTGPPARSRGDGDGRGPAGPGGGSAP